jgi:hypothetical protein
MRGTVTTPRQSRGSFTAGGVYAHPLTGDGLSGDELRDHVQSVLDVLRDLRIAVTRTVANENAAAVVWAAECTWDGVLGRQGLGR